VSLRRRGVGKKSDASPQRRKDTMHFNVTEYPTAAWTAQQIIEAFPDETLRGILKSYFGYFTDSAMQDRWVVFSRCSGPRKLDSFRGPLQII
jgi:hypothetical protein